MHSMDAGAQQQDRPARFWPSQLCVQLERFCHAIRRIYLHGSHYELSTHISRYSSADGNDPIGGISVRILQRRPVIDLARATALQYWLMAHQHVVAM